MPPPAAAPTLGPHGDVVSGGDPDDEPAAPRRIRQVDRAPAPPPPALLTGYQWPIQNARITNSFGPGRPGSFRLDGAPFHDGIDLSSFCGARITAAHDGVVLVAGRRHHEFQGWVGDLGPFHARLDAMGGWRSQAIVVVIDDGNGYRSIYAHLGLAAVEPGEAVRAGDLIGWQGASGNATGCHLHFAIFSPLEEETVALDPRLVRKSKLPPAQIARIDPLLVLPPMSEAGITWGWGAR
jgi:murein DD-endopeptidase MepM/ murein hydrolase activator NlpD